MSKLKSVKKSMEKRSTSKQARKSKRSTSKQARKSKRTTSKRSEKKLYYSLNDPLEIELYKKKQKLINKNKEKKELRKFVRELTSKIHNLEKDIKLLVPEIKKSVRRKKPNEEVI